MTLSNFWQASNENKLTPQEWNELLHIINIHKRISSDLGVRLEKLKPQICQD